MVYHHGSREVPALPGLSCLLWFHGCLGRKNVLLESNTCAMAGSFRVRVSPLNLSLVLILRGISMP